MSRLSLLQSANRRYRTQLRSSIERLSRFKAESIEANLTPAQKEQRRQLDFERARCKADFVYWCEQYVWVEDKDSHDAIRLQLYDCQKRVAEHLVAKDWLWILKARRLGLTWLLAAYSVWLISSHDNRTIVVLNQTKEYAQDFLDRCRFIQDRLPLWQQTRRVADSKTRIDFDRGGWIRSVACTKRSIHSVAADLVIFDEAAYMDLLNSARMAAQPAVEIGHGQIVGISTSAGPSGDFYDVWDAASTGKNKYKPIFLHWREHPKRDDAWYEKEKTENAADPLYMKRQYPATAEEAFESAEGRVFPLFVRSPRFITQLAVGDESAKSWKRYRAIDWGGADPFVCLWGAIVPGDGPGLTVDPSCPNLIRELLGYSYDKGKPQETENHAVDALRYMVTSPGMNGLHGHLHIYRELYEPNSAAKGFGIDDMARRIASASGTEKFDCTVADRSRPDNIRTYFNLGLACQGQRHLGGMGVGEIEQGIVQMNALIVAWAKQKSVAIPEQRPVTWPKQSDGRPFDPLRPVRTTIKPIFG